MLKICRFCLCRDETSLIFLANSLDSEHTIHDVMIYTGIQIHANQLDAYVVCLECTKILNNFASFRKICHINDSAFHELWLAASGQEIQDENVEFIELSNSAEETMDFVDDKYQPVEEEENHKQTDFVANDVCQKISVVREYIQDSQQTTSNDEEEAGFGDFYSANYIKPADSLFTDDFYFAESFSSWSCYYWPPKRPNVSWQREPGKRKLHLCDVCGLIVGHIPTHALIHNPQPTHACPYCSVKMKQKSGIVQHIQTVHLKVVSKTCHICGKTFVHRKTYVYHMRAHNEAEESFECKVCSKTFFRSITLAAHMRKVHSIARRL